MAQIGALENQENQENQEGVSPHNDAIKADISKEVVTATGFEPVT